MNTTNGGIITISEIISKMVPLIHLAKNIIPLSTGADIERLKASNSFSRTNILCNPNALAKRIITQNSPGANERYIAGDALNARA
jgi:hypothetical protein